MQVLSNRHTDKCMKKYSRGTGVDIFTTQPILYAELLCSAENYEDKVGCNQSDRTFPFEVEWLIDQGAVKICYKGSYLTKSSGIWYMQRHHA